MEKPTLTSILESWVSKAVGELKASETSAALAASYADLAGKLEELETILKPLSAELRFVSTSRLPELFSRDGVKTITTENGYRITVTHRIFAGFKDGMRDDGYEWLREHDYGDLITETVNASSLSSLAKSLVEEGRELPEDIFNVAVVNGVSKTKVAKK